MSPGQAAGWLGVKPSTLQRWRTSNRYPLPYIILDGGVRYLKADVVALLARHGRFRCRSGDDDDDRNNGQDGNGDRNGDGASLARVLEAFKDVGVRLNPVAHVTAGDDDDWKLLPIARLMEYGLSKYVVTHILPQNELHTLGALQYKSDTDAVAAQKAIGPGNWKKVLSALERFHMDQ